MLNMFAGEVSYEVVSSAGPVHRPEWVILAKVNLESGTGDDAFNV